MPHVCWYSLWSFQPNNKSIEHTNKRRFLTNKALADLTLSLQWHHSSVWWDEGRFLVTSQRPDVFFQENLQVSDWERIPQSVEWCIHSTYDEHKNDPRCPLVRTHTILALSPTAQQSTKGQEVTSAMNYDKSGRTHNDLVPDARLIGMLEESSCSSAAPPPPERDVSPRTEAKSHLNEDAQQTIKQMELELKHGSQFWVTLQSKMTYELCSLILKH